MPDWLSAPTRLDQMIWGPVLILGLLQYLFQGVIFTQAIKFHERSAEDPPLLKFYVAGLVFFSVLQTALETYKVWVLTVLRSLWWANPFHCTEFFFNGFICTLSEAFLICQCWKLTGRNSWVLGSLVILNMTTCMANIYLTVKIALVSAVEVSFTEDPLKVSAWAFPLWVYGSLALSLCLTAILSFCLWRARTGIDYLDKMLAYVVAVTWESAALPCVCLIIGGILFATTPLVTAHLDLLFLMNTGKLFTLGILSTLNSRMAFRKRISSVQLGRLTLSEDPRSSGQLHIHTDGGTSTSSEGGNSHKSHIHRQDHDPETPPDNGPQTRHSSGDMLVAPPTRPPDAPLV